MIPPICCFSPESVSHVFHVPLLRNIGRHKEVLNLANPVQEGLDVEVAFKERNLDLCARIARRLMLAVPVLTGMVTVISAAASVVRPTFSSLARRIFMPMSVMLTYSSLANTFKRGKGMMMSWKMMWGWMTSRMLVVWG
jgi:hypothetical protein